MLNAKRNIIILIFICLLFGAFGSFALADRPLEVSYPDIPNTIRPTTIKTLLTDYIKYIFNFAIGISGLIAFGSLVYGGVRYVASAGSPEALNDARSQMVAGILGLVVLLASYLILTTVNPQLVIFAPNVSVNWGIIIYKDSECSSDSKDITKDARDFGGDFNNVASMRFRASSGSLDVNIYPDTDYGGDPNRFSSDNQDCQLISGKSVKFIWKLPGVYLVNTHGQEKFLPASTATLESGFNDQIRDIKFNNSSGVDFGVILHENQSWKGECKVFRSNAQNIDFGGRTSSATVFTQSNQNVGDGVTFYEDDTSGGRNFGTYQNGNFPSIQSIPNIVDGSNDAVTSLRIQGNYIAVLFDNEDFGGTCQVFTESNANLRDDPIGRCRCGPFGWGCIDCLSSFIIISTR